MFTPVMERNGERLVFRSVMNVYTDFMRRRAGIIKALTTDYDEFSAKCDPEARYLSLYGLPSGEWEVREPAGINFDRVGIPEPVTGINFDRVGIPEKDWLAVVAVRCDTWLISVAFYLGANFDKDDRKRLFNLINDQPSVFEVVSGESPRLTEDRPMVSNDGSSTSTSYSGLMCIQHGEGEDGACGACEECDKGEDRFWICCDECSTWYHGMCVNVTPAEARRKRCYKCPPCSKKIKLWNESGSYFVG